MMLKSVLVLGLIETPQGKMLGRKVYNFETNEVTNFVDYEKQHYLNLKTSFKGDTYKLITLSEFPRYICETLHSEPTSIEGAKAWVLKRHADGRLTLVSVYGQLKTVTPEVALSYHKQFGIVGCSVSDKGDLIPHRGYKGDCGLDKEAAQALIALKYASGTDLTMLLLDACRAGDLETVKLLLSSELVVLGEDSPAVRHACIEGHTEIVALLLAYGAHVIGVNYDVLSMAADRGHLEVCKLLLAYGAGSQWDKDQALLAALRAGALAGEPVRKGRLDLVVLLLENGADVHSRQGAPLQTALEFGHEDTIVDIVTVLLAHGTFVASINTQLLVMSVAYGHWVLARHLLATGVTKEKAISYAIKKGYASTTVAKLREFVE